MMHYVESQVQQHHSYTVSMIILKEHLNTLYVCCFEFLHDSAIIFSPQGYSIKISTICSKQA